MAVILLLFLVLFLFISIKTYFNRKVGMPPKAGGALPIVGHAWLAFVKVENLYGLLADKMLGSWFKRDEEVTYFHAGTWKAYICLDPDDGYLLLNSCLKKDPIYKFLNSWVGGENGLLNADVPTWKIHRKMLNPTFNQNVLDSYLTEFNEQARLMVGLLAQEAGKGYFDPLSYVKQTVIQIVCVTIMGVNVSDDKQFMDDYSKAVETFTGYLADRIKKFYYHSDFLYNLSYTKKRQDAVAKKLHNLSYKVIKNKKKQISAKKESNSLFRRSFLDLLLQMGEDGALTEHEIQQEVNTFIAAAFDTSSHTLGMILLTIGSYPDVQQKIHNELQALFEGSSRDVEKQDMSKLKYLEAVIKETMRLYPMVVTVGRTVDKDLQLKKYTLPAGSRCFVSIYHLGRHRSWGADADQFRPERWLDGSLPQNSGAYAVFGLGRRSCIGSNFAMMMMKTVLCHVVRRYRISGDVTRLVQKINVVVSPASGHHISIEQRNA